MEMDLSDLGPTLAKPTKAPTTIKGGRQTPPSSQPVFTLEHEEHWVPVLKFIPVCGQIEQVEIDIGNPRIIHGRTYHRMPSGTWLDQQFTCGMDGEDALRASLGELEACRQELRRREMFLLGKVFASAKRSTIGSPSKQLTMEGLL